MSKGIPSGLFIPTPSTRSRSPLGVPAHWPAPPSTWLLTSNRLIFSCPATKPSANPFSLLWKWLLSLISLMTSASFPWEQPHTSHWGAAGRTTTSSPHTTDRDCPARSSLFPRPRDKWKSALGFFARKSFFPTALLNRSTGGCRCHLSEMIPTQTGADLRKNGSVPTVWVEA